MPHQVIEYSNNLSDHVDVAELVGTMHEVAAGVEAFPLGGLRTRAVSREHYRIADGHPDNCFVNVTMRFAMGRSSEVVRDAGETLFTALVEFLDPVFANTPLAISLELQEINPDARWKKNNIRDFLKQRSD